MIMVTETVGILIIPSFKLPILKRRQKQAGVFNRFYSSAPFYSLTWANVLTGRHHLFRVNVLNHGHYLRPQETTIAEKVKEVGYVNEHFGK